MNNSLPNGRSLAEVVGDAKEEIKEFAQTRFQLLKTELQEKFALLKIAALLASVAAVFLVTAYLLVTLALAALVAASFPDNPYRWVFGFLGIGILWAIAGAAAGYFAKREF